MTDKEVWVRCESCNLLKPEKEIKLNDGLCDDCKTSEQITPIILV